MHFLSGYMFWDGNTQALSFCDLTKPWIFFFFLLKNMGREHARVPHGWALDLVFLSPYGMFGIHLGPDLPRLGRPKNESRPRGPGKLTQDSQVRASVHRDSKSTEVCRWSAGRMGKSDERQCRFGGS